MPVSTLVKPVFHLAQSTQSRLEDAGIDISSYPEYPPKPKTIAAARAVQGDEWHHEDPGLRADPEKKALFAAAKEVKHLGHNLGTEIVGLQLSQLTDQQKDELALLVAERTVVFFRDQDLTPQAQRELGAYYGKVEVHPTAPRVPGLPGVSVISDQIAKNAGEKLGFSNPFGTQLWHTDLTHHAQPPSITHLHLDAAPTFGGDTLWASGYSAYDKLTPPFQATIDNLKGVYRSAHSYPNPDDPEGPEVWITRAHPLVRVHPVTGWKSLFVNRRYTIGIEGYNKAEGDAILNLLFDVYEKNLDIQVRFNWTPRTSAIWDNRISIHAAVYDYGADQNDTSYRHGTRVSTLAEKPYNIADAPSRRRALGLDL